MREVVLSMSATLDGFGAGPNGEMDWVTYEARADQDLQEWGGASCLPACRQSQVIVKEDDHEQQSADTRQPSYPV